MQPTCLLTLCVLRGSKLPSTDLLSKTDAYVKVKVDGGLVGKTLAKQDTNDPVWNRDFVLTLPLSSSRMPAGRVELELWDQDTFKDSHVATAVLDFSKVTDPACLTYIELPLEFEKSKHAAAGAQSRLVVGVKGWVNAFGSLLAETQHIPGALFNPVSRRAYLPVPCPGLPPNSIYLAVEYEKEAVDLKLLVCSRATQQLHADMFLLGRAVSKVRRRCYRDGLQVLPGLTVYEEIKMDDVPLTTDWRQLCVVVFDKTLLWCGDSDAIVSAHGWRGAMNFEGACSVLHGVEFDHAKREMYMPLVAAGGGGGCAVAVSAAAAGAAAGPFNMAASPPNTEALLLIDYDQSNVDVKLAVLDSPGGLDKAWDISLQSGQQVTKSSQVYVPAEPRAGGKWRVCRVCQLDDVAYGTAFSSIMLYKYQLSNHRQWDVASLVPLR